MNLEHLRLFVRIASTHNISAAGQELGLSPAVASSYISKLEQGLGVRLVHRTTRKVSLTGEGEAFLPHAEEVLAHLEAARASVGLGSSDPSGTLRVAAPASFARMHLVPAMKGFCQRYPELNVEFRLSDTIIDMVEGGFDVAVRDAALQDSSFIARKLAEDTRIVCASPEYLAEHGEPANPQELQQHQCITLVGLENWSFDSPNGRVTVKAKGSFRADNGDAIRDASVAGMGITLGSLWSVYRELAEGKLVRVLEDYPLLSDTAIWAVYPSSRLLAPKVRVFIDYLLEYYGRPAYWEE